MTSLTSSAPFSLFRYTVPFGCLVWLSSTGLSQTTSPSCSTEQSDEMSEGLPHLIEIGRYLKTKPPDVQTFCGGKPADQNGFQSLASLGVRTVVSVDASPPRLDIACKFGLQYVHIPLAYSGIDGMQVEALARVLLERPAPIYIHCHHGQHRAPAAAACALVAIGHLDAEQAVEFMQRAGTGSQYQGLYESVKQVRPVDPTARLPELFESVAMESLSSRMAQVEEYWEQFEQTLQESAASKKQLAHQSLLLAEGLREIHRQFERPEEDGKPDRRDARLRRDFWQAYETSRQIQVRVAESLDSEQVLSKDRQLMQLSKQLQTQCQSCHQSFRN